MTMVLVIPILILMLILIFIIIIIIICVIIIFIITIFIIIIITNTTTTTTTTIIITTIITNKSAICFTHKIQPKPTLASHTPSTNTTTKGPQREHGEVSRERNIAQHATTLTFAHSLLHAYFTDTSLTAGEKKMSVYICHWERDLISFRNRKKIYKIVVITVALRLIVWQFLLSEWPPYRDNIISHHH